MDTEERTQSAKLERERLKDGRRNNPAVESAVRDRESHGRAPGYGVQNDAGNTKIEHGSNQSDERNSRPSGGRDRGADAEPRRIGRPTGRPGESNSSALNSPAGGVTGTTITRTAGRLETDDQIPARQEEKEETPEFGFSNDEASLAKHAQHYKESYFRTKRDGQNVYALISDKSQVIDSDRYNSLTNAPKTRESEQKREGRGWLNSLTFGKPANSSVTHDSLDSSSSQSHTKASELPFLKEQKVLSAREAEQLLEPLIAALQSDFEYIDQGIWLYCMSEDKRPVWSDMDIDEVGVLATIMLKRGQHSPQAAQAVRALIDSDIYIQVAAITLPRAVTTYTMIKGSPRPAMRKKQREARKEAGQRGRPV